jgi:hypothetical protein
MYWKNKRRMKTVPLHQALASNEYHPHFISAVLSSATAQANHENTGDQSIPAIEFTTDSDIRRSMTLNGMRMATEFFAYGSPRVLTLIEQRLQDAQRDVVHDVLVYLWERVLLIRANALEAKNLQAESLAAYLGLEPKRVSTLLEETPLSAARVAERIEHGDAGKVQRALNVAALTENLLARLQPELEEEERNQERVLFLIDEIVARLYRNGI